MARRIIFCVLVISGAVGLNYITALPALNSDALLMNWESGKSQSPVLVWNVDSPANETFTLQQAEPDRSVLVAAKTRVRILREEGPFVRVEIEDGERPGIVGWVHGWSVRHTGLVVSALPYLIGAIFGLALFCAAIVFRAPAQTFFTQKTTSAENQNGNASGLTAEQIALAGVGLGVAVGCLGIYLYDTSPEAAGMHRGESPTSWVLICAGTILAIGGLIYGQALARRKDRQARNVDPSTPQEVLPIFKILYWSGTLPAAGLCLLAVCGALIAADRHDRIVWIGVCLGAFSVLSAMTLARYKGGAFTPGTLKRAVLLGTASISLTGALAAAAAVYLDGASADRGPSTTGTIGDAGLRDPVTRPTSASIAPSEKINPATTSSRQESDYLIAVLSDAEQILSEIKTFGGLAMQTARGQDVAARLRSSLDSLRQLETQERNLVPPLRYRQLHVDYVRALAEVGTIAEEYASSGRSEFDLLHFLQALKTDTTSLAHALHDIENLGR